MVKTKTVMVYVIALVMLFALVTGIVVSAGDDVSAKETIEAAEVSAQECVITYEGDFGDEIVSYTIIVDKGDAVPFDMDPPKGDGEFVGWYTSSGEKIEVGSIVNTDLTLTARFN